MCPGLEVFWNEDETESLIVYTSDKATRDRKNECDVSGTRLSRLDGRLFEKRFDSMKDFRNFNWNLFDQKFKLHRAQKSTDHSHTRYIMI